MEGIEPTILTICYPITETQILLGKKKMKPNAKHYVYGVGLYNGFGGHKKPNETTLQTAIRELKDESGLVANKLIKLGIVLVYYRENKTLTELHYYIATIFRGKVIETDEMRSFWCDKKNIPLNIMWPNDVYYMDMILNNECFIGYFVMDNPDNKKIISHRIEPIEKLPDHLDHVTFLKSIKPIL